MDQQSKSLQQMTLETAVAQFKTVGANISVAHIVSGSSKNGGELCSPVSELYLGTHLRKSI